MKSKNNMEKMNQGIFKPFEFYKIKELNSLDLDVLAFYRYYTLEGHNHCCEMSNEKICEKFYGRFGVRNLRMIKKKLKDLGLIKTDGGIKVWYVGDEEAIQESPEKNENNDEGGQNLSPQGGKNPVKGEEKSCIEGRKNPVKGEEESFLHKKEKKEKKEIKKEIKKEKDSVMKNDLILDEMIDRKNKPEFKEWVYANENLKNVIDAIKNNEEDCYDKDTIKDKVGFWYKVWYNETKEWINEKNEEKKIKESKKSKEEDKKDLISEMMEIEWL